MRDLYLVYNCQNIIKDKTCFKDLHNPSCVNLFMTNRLKSFQNSMEIETGLSGFHKMSLTVMNDFYKKKRPNILRYWNYRNFEKKLYINEVKNSIE